MTITEATRQYVRQRANYLCEYCHSPEEISTSRFTIDHIKLIESNHLTISDSTQSDFMDSSFG
ncbi:MAG: HNH endonuclease [Coleofasciculus sp.]